MIYLYFASGATRPHFANRPWVDLQQHGHDAKTAQQSQITIQRYSENVIAFLRNPGVSSRCRT